VQKNWCCDLCRVGPRGRPCDRGGKDLFSPVVALAWPMSAPPAHLWGQYWEPKFFAATLVAGCARPGRLPTTNCPKPDPAVTKKCEVWLKKKMSSPNKSEFTSGTA
jgi:hypothetical protein